MATRYIDFTNNNGNLSGTWTNTTTTFNGSGGAALTELAVGDYIGKVSGKLTWYQVTAVTDDDTFTVDFNPSTGGVAEVFSAEVIQFWDSSVNDGSTTSLAYCSLHACRHFETQASGDIWYYRGGQEEYLHATGFSYIETAGTSSAYTKFIIDTSGAIFGDSSPGRTIIRHLRARGTCTSTVNYGYYEGFQFAAYGTGDNRCTQMSVASQGYFFKNCYWSQDGGAAGDGMIIRFSESIDQWGEFEDCEFETTGNTIFSVGLNRNGNMAVEYRFCYFYKSSSVPGASVTSSFPGIFSFYDCVFGESPTDTNRPLSNGIVVGGKWAIIRRPRFNCTTDVVSPASVQNGRCYIEDYDNVVGDHRQYFTNGTIQTETSTVRTGGGDVSVKMTPNSDTNTVRPLYFQDFPFEVPVYLSSGVSKTISMYVNTFGWTTLPTNTELSLEVKYYSHATDPDRATANSTQTVASNGTWTELSVNFTPSQDGLAYCRIKLQKYEASSGVYIDPIPAVS